MKKLYLGALIFLLSSATDGVFAQAKADDKTEENTVYKRFTPTEINALPQKGASEGTSGVKGIQTRILKGDPAKAGLYTIQLTIPANTRIQAHDHPDERVATVISGTWYFGYGSVFDEENLKGLTPGSFYTEPPDVSHFARTGKSAVVLQITGYGPTGTRYAEK